MPAPPPRTRAASAATAARTRRMLSSLRPRCITYIGTSVAWLKGGPATDTSPISPQAVAAGRARLRDFS